MIKEKSTHPGGQKKGIMVGIYEKEMNKGWNIREEYFGKIMMKCYMKFMITYENCV